MRIGILIGACGLAVAAATQADVTSTTMAPVTNKVEDRSVDALHRAIGAPGSMMRDEIVRDLKTRVERGEVSPFKVLLSDALPDWKVAGVGDSFGPNRILGGELSLNTSRGAVAASFDDTFSTYPLSTDPIFDRFQVNMQDQVNPSGEAWSNVQTWYIPSLFVAGQVDVNDPTISDPLPRWQGATLDENVNLGALSGDINAVPGDGVVDSADLGTLIGSFGMTGPAGPPSFIPADLNADGVVDSADLGSLISQFGQTSGPFCLYSVDVAQTTDTDGIPLDPATIAAGPAVTQVIAVLNGTYTNDADMDGCPDCGFFAIDTDANPNPGVLVYGDWTLTDPAAADASTADFKATVVSDTCSGYGTEAVLADARMTAGVSENACCFFGARTMFPLFAPVVGTQLIMDVDVYLTTLDTFQWVDTTSSVEGFTVTRTFMGGFASSLTTQFLKYSTGGDGFVNHFIFLGNLPGVFTIGQFYGTAPDPLLPTPGGVANTGIEIKTGEWFTLSYRLSTDEVSIWLKDSETTALVDALPGDDGSGTPLDGSDDLEAGFAKIFPFGPFGIAPGTADGLSPDIPQGPLAAVSMDTFRFLWAGDPTQAEVPGYEAHNQFYDNIHVEGLLFPVPDLPKFALNYVDDIETYFAGANLALQGGRWFDALSSRAIIDDFVSASGANSILQDNPFGDGNFRLEFQTDLPLSLAEPANGLDPATPWTAATNISVSNTTVVRTIRLGYDTVSLDPDTATVARLLTGVQNVNGIVVVDMNGSSTIHLRVKNPNFNPAVEASPRDVDLEPDLVASPNPRFINVPTDAKVLNTDLNSFINYSFTVDSAKGLVVKKNGVTINPDNTGLALAAGYSDPMNPANLANGGGWLATSNAMDEMSFESGNQQGGAFVALNVDDVTVDGFGPVIAAGPTYALPYADDFESYPLNAPINGQGDTPFIDGASVVDTNLCIEQGIQALNTTPSAIDNWCRYLIKSDSIGGIDPANAWGLADGDEIFVRQATAFGPAIDCKVLECFTNPNRPDEFFANVGLFDDPMAMAPKAAAGVRVVNNGIYVGDPLVDGITTNAMACFDWDTYDPANVFCKYTIDTIDDADPNTAGQQNISTPSLRPTSRTTTTSVASVARSLPRASSSLLISSSRLIL